MKISRTFIVLAFLLVAMSCSISEDENLIFEENSISQDENFVALLNNAIILRDITLETYVAREEDSNIHGGGEHSNGCFFAHADGNGLLKYIRKTEHLSTILDQALINLEILLNEREAERGGDKHYDILDEIYPRLKKIEPNSNNFNQTIIENLEGQEICQDVLIAVNNDIAHIVTEIVTVGTGSTDDTVIFEVE